MTTPLDTMRSLQGTTWSPDQSNNGTVLGWLSAIATAYPDMASYCASVGQNYFSWCGATIAHCMAQNGIRPVFGASEVDKFLYAMAWLEFGTAVDTPQAGDVLVFNFGGGDHHVTLFVSDNGDGTYLCFGGNQSHAVKSSSYAKASIMGIRRPPAVAVQPSLPPAPNIPPPDWHQGKGSWYSQFPVSAGSKYGWRDTGDDPGSNRLGVPDPCQGISFLDTSAIGTWFEVQAPNGTTSLEQQTEKGPASWTGRSIDISAVAAERFGYSPSNFPTDAIFKWRPASPPHGLEALSPQQQAAQYFAQRGTTPTQEIIMPPTPAVTPPPSAGPTPLTVEQVIQILTAMRPVADALGQKAAANPQGPSNMLASIIALLSGFAPLLGTLGIGGSALLNVGGLMGPLLGAAATPTSSTAAATFGTMIIGGLVHQFSNLVSHFGTIASSLQAQQSGTNTPTQTS